MWPIAAEDLWLLRNSKEFDAEWYLSRYPDVRAVGLDPAVHYLRYGFRIGRDPGPDFSTRFYQHAFASQVKGREPLTTLARQQQPEVDRHRVFLAAYRVFETGAHQQALELANRYLGVNERHTLDILRANVALAERDDLGWLTAVNAYLSHFGMASISLAQPVEPESSHFDRLTARPVTPVRDGPMISVLMAVHNASSSLEQAVRSVLNQSWQNLELIIVDDCSSDDSWAVLQGLATEDARVQLRHLPVNVGPYVARNLALGMANGEWITCHDADDWAHPCRLETHLGTVLKSSVPDPASLTYMVRMQPNGYFDTIVNANPFSPDGVTRISSVSALYNAKFLKEKLGFWDSVRVGADSEMIARAEVVLGRDISKLSQIGMLCLSTEQGLTRDPVLGVRLRGQLSPARTAYKESWSAVHRSVPPDQLYLPFPQKNRRYQGDFGFSVPYRDIFALYDPSGPTHGC